jgi:WhiB family redox-sensing transcriptional regulator
LAEHQDPFAFARGLFKPRGDASWMDRAACLNADPDQFFPDEEGKSSAKHARTVCATCPVVRECAEFGIRNHEYGIWGGLTDKQRDDIRRARKRRKAAA